MEGAELDEDGVEEELLLWLELEELLLLLLRLVEDELDEADPGLI